MRHRSVFTFVTVIFLFLSKSYTAARAVGSVLEAGLTIHDFVIVMHYTTANRWPA